MLVHTENRKRYAALRLQEITSEPMTQVSGGMHSKFCTSEVHRTRPCNGLQRGHTRPDAWRVSFTPAINKSEDYALNNVSMFFAPSAPAYTHARALDEKSKICKADDNVRAEIFLPSTHPS